MAVPFRDLALDYLRHRDSIDAGIARVLQSGRFVLGDTVIEFEKRFAEFTRTQHAVAVASGTDALHLALRAAGVRQGDEVVTVAHTCVPTVTAITMAGADPVFVDVDPVSYTIDPARIEERITARTRAIVPVHLYGQCADMHALNEIAARYDLVIVEDCAQAHGALFDGRHAGTMSAAGAFSFYPTKNLGCYGDGGAVICQGQSTYEQLNLLRNYGQAAQYQHEQKGYNSRLDELQAAVLLAKLPTVGESNARRRNIAAYYRDRLSGLSWIVPPEELPKRHHVYHQFVVRVSERASFRAYLEGKGVGTAIHYPTPVHMQPAYSEYRDHERWLPVAMSLAQEILSLPLYPELTDGQVERVVEAVVSAPINSAA